LDGWLAHTPLNTFFDHKHNSRYTRYKMKTT
jgi:hypothetical protein